MQESESKNLKWEVMVGSLPGDYVVETFSDDYSAHIESKKLGEPAGFLSFIGFLIGAVLCLVGFLTLIFGPSTVMVSMLRGPTFIQFIQLYPGPIFSLGAIIIGITSWTLKPETVMTPEAYLLHYYSVVCPDSTELNEKIVAEYKGENTFHLSRTASAETASSG
ncbi:hypothetical protein [Pseudomonas putida]|uniref:hypothetical protein n=1 Tax=Pseudomonas putida TaxID=303 RepID=UPI002364FEB3|nr:hypothetical protein [Pseudomonas putida]MDD2047011.1 hypothetical protein [Pseudomonas putida]